LSPKTVETHIRGAFMKLGIRESPEANRRVLAVLAFLSVDRRAGASPTTEIP
jgi:DNA-binding CsgD family transcriptional regulator